MAGPSAGIVGSLSPGKFVLLVRLSRSVRTRPAPPTGLDDGISMLPDGLKIELGVF